LSALVYSQTQTQRESAKDAKDAKEIGMSSLRIRRLNFTMTFPSNFGLQGSIVQYGLLEAEMKRILKREYTAEFREQAVAMVNNGRSVPQVAEQLGLIAQTLRNWVKAAERGRLNEKVHKVTEEQMELSRLRAENAQLKMENEILKKATAYFAKDRL